MENFLCDNPVILQDAAKFGLISWVIPFTILYLCLSFTRQAWIKEKKLHEKLGARGWDVGRKDLKYFWIGPGISIFVFLCLSFFVLQDRATKLNALKNTEYRTYQGHVAEIYRVDKRARARYQNRINFKITGHAIDSDGGHHELNRYNNRVTTKSSIIADWGNNCSGYTCGLSIGDKVRIKQVPVKTYFGGDTLSIEKCDSGFHQSPAETVKPAVNWISRIIDFAVTFTGLTGALIGLGLSFGYLQIIRLRKRRK